MNKNKIKMLDLFSGAGGLTYGFYKNGFEIKETFENNKDAAKTFELNFKHKARFLDITDNNLKKEIATKNKIDIVIGGFPCQGYSMAGKRSKIDPRNQLYIHTIKIIKLTKPKVFVLENVKGILSFVENDGMLVIDKIRKKLNEIGYYTKLILLNSADFNVPQNRERVIFIGAKKQYKVQVDKTITQLSQTKMKKRTVYEFINCFEKQPENHKLSHIFSKHSKQMIDKIAKTKVNESLYKNFKDAFRRIDYYSQSPTVKENHGGVHIHPVLNRVLTPRELAALQTFDNDFYFVGTKSSVLKQIGNAVPPNMSKIIAKIIKENFFND